MGEVRRWTAADDDSLRAHHAAGGTLSAYARDQRWSKRTVGLHAESLGLTWSAPPMAAMQRRDYSVRESRASRRDWALEVARKTMERLTGDEYVGVLRLAGGAEEVTTMPVVPAQDWRHLTSSLASMSGMLDRLDAADGGPDVEAGVSMLQSLAAALRAVVPEDVPDGPEGA